MEDIDKIDRAELRVERPRFLHIQNKIDNNFTTK